MFYLSLFTFVFFVAITMADVKKEYGEFLLKHLDTVERDLFIQRNYSSRTLFKGVFGFNWCSSLDLQLNISTNSVRLYSCELARYLSFEKINAFQYKHQELLIQKENYYYVYTDTSNGTEMTYYFSLSGRLSHWSKNKKPFVYIIYRHNKIDQLLIKKAKPVQVWLTKSGLIQKIGIHTSYDYHFGVLKKVSKKELPIWKYEYDEFLNMTHWHGLGHFESMKYDNEWDRIIYLKDKNACRFNFRYETKASKKYILESQKCLNSTQQDKVFELLGPKLLIKSPNDQLDKKFRNADSITEGGNHANF